MRCSLRSAAAVIALLASSTASATWVEVTLSSPGDGYRIGSDGVREYTPGISAPDAQLAAGTTLAAGTIVDNRVATEAGFVAFRGYYGARTEFHLESDGAYVYLDAGGVGVCGSLDAAAQCLDDSSIGLTESLTLTYYNHYGDAIWRGQQSGAAIKDLVFSDEFNNPFSGTIQVTIDGISRLLSVLNGAASYTFYGVKTMTFNAEAGSTGEFKVRRASMVPVPAAVWMFGSGLLALAGWRKRRHMA